MSRLQQNCIKVTTVLLFCSLIFLALKMVYSVDESQAEAYYKACASRRGKLRDAKKEKKIIAFHQERIGVIRQLWIEEPSSPIRLQREFYIEADQAQLDAALQGKSKSIVETFQMPKGWLQEELYWEVARTKERVIPKVNEKGEISSWIYASSAMQKGEVDPDTQKEIIPKQHVRYFDAVKADWDMQRHEMIAYSVGFCVVELYGHTATKEINRSQIVLEGIAETMKLSFSDESHQKMVETTGFKAISTEKSLKRI